MAGKEEEVTTGELSFTTRRADLTKSGTPLREFKGVLHSIVPKQETRGGQIQTIGELNFTDVEVVKSETPYPHPTATLGIRYSQRERSTWGLLLLSLDKFGVQDLNDLRGKKLLMKSYEKDWSQGRERLSSRQTQARTPATDAPPDEPMVGLVWEVAGVDGVAAGQSAAAAPDPQRIALELLHGKTASEFAQAALENPVLRTKSSDIISGAMLTGLVASGLAKLEGDRYAVVGYAVVGR